jgi:hypothetical protein
MTNDQFCASLKRLNLKRAGTRTAAALGLSMRQLQRITAGHAPVSSTLALLVISYLKRGGIPDPLWNPDLSQIDVIMQAAAKLDLLQIKLD